MKKFIFFPLTAVMTACLFLTIEAKSHLIQNIFGTNQVTLETQLFPSPEGVGGSASYFGARMVLDGNRALITAPGIGDKGSVVYLEYSNTHWEILQFLQVTGLDYNEKLGSSLSLHGNRAVIGSAYSDTQFGNGSAYVFEYNGSVWQQSAKLTPSDGADGDGFGQAVSVFGDQILVGAPFKDQVGESYVFEFENNQWVEKSKLNNGMATFLANFGTTVHLQGDTAFVGAPYNDDVGSVFVFQSTNGVWDDGVKLSASIVNHFQNFGTDLSISNNKLLIGAPSYIDNHGAAYVFDYIDNNWVETQILTPHGPESERHFGEFVSISNDNALVGAFHFSYEDEEPGHAYFYTLSNATWTESAKITDGEQGFGNAVALSNDHILVANLTNNNNAGAVYDYALDQQTWTMPEKVTVTPGAPYENFGQSVDTSDQWSFVGAPKQSEYGLHAVKGEVHVFQNQGQNWIHHATLSASDGFARDRFGHALSHSGNRLLVGAPADYSGENSGAAYVFEFDGQSWVETQKLSPSDLNIDDTFGWSVSLSGDRALVSAPWHARTDGGRGVVYVFEYNGDHWVETTQLSGGTYNFGWSVSLWDNNALIGNPYTNEDSGEAYLFEYNNNSWQKPSILNIANGNGNELFGFSVSINNNMALIGAPGSGNYGAAYVFVKDNNEWIESEILTASDGVANGIIGWHVSLSGNYAAISTQNEFFGPNPSAVYTYKMIASEWLEQQIIIPDDGVSADNFGNAFSIFGDRIIIGANMSDVRGTNSGTAYIYNLGENTDLIFSSSFDQ